MKQHILKATSYKVPAWDWCLPWMRRHHGLQKDQANAVTEVETVKQKSTVHLHSRSLSRYIKNACMRVILIHHHDHLLQRWRQRVTRVRGSQPILGTQSLYLGSGDLWFCGDPCILTNVRRDLRTISQDTMSPHFTPYYSLCLHLIFYHGATSRARKFNLGGEQPVGARQKYCPYISNCPDTTSVPIPTSSSLHSLIHS